MRADVRLIAVWLCLTVPAAAAAQVGDVGVEKALAARDAGRTQEAIVLFEKLSRERPDDPTILRLLGTSYAAARRYREAAAVLARAQAFAPRDQDIALARARVALWSERFDEALAIVDRIETAEPDNPEAPQVRAAILVARTPAPGMGVSAALGISRVSLRGGSQSWKEGALSFDTRLGRRTRAAFDVEHFDRSGLADTRLGARLDRQIGEQAEAYIGASLTPRADFRERWSLRAGGEARLAGAVSITLDGRHSLYGTGGVTAIEPGLRVQTRDGRFAVAARSINLWDEEGEHRAGWSGRVDAAASERLRLFAGAASYPDTEAGVTRQVDAFFAGSDVSLTSGLGLRISVDRERRAESYRRTGLTIGLRWRPAE